MLSQDLDTLHAQLAALAQGIDAGTDAGAGPGAWGHMARMAGDCAIQARALEQGVVPSSAPPSADACPHCRCPIPTPEDDDALEGAARTLDGYWDAVAEYMTVSGTGALPGATVVDLEDRARRAEDTAGAVDPLAGQPPAIRARLQAMQAAVTEACQRFFRPVVPADGEAADAPNVIPLRRPSPTGGGAS